MPYENDAAGIALMESHVATVIRYISPFGVWAVNTITERVNQVNSQIDVVAILSHMADFGWLAYRFDIGLALVNNPHQEIVSFQLTDEGRILKSLGDIPTYHSFVANRRNEELRRQQLNDTLLESNLINGTITKRLYVATAWIAVTGIVAALYYLLQVAVMLHSLPSSYFLPLPSWLALSSVALLLVGSACFGAILWHILTLINRKKIKQATT